MAQLSVFVDDVLLFSVTMLMLVSICRTVVGPNKILHMAVHETPTLGFLSARAELWPILMQDSRRQQSVAANVASAELPIDGGPRNAWHASRPHVLAALAVTATYCT